MFGIDVILIMVRHIFYRLLTCVNSLERALRVGDQACREEVAVSGAALETTEHGLNRRGYGTRSKA
jgi:hypothetical protein